MKTFEERYTAWIDGGLDGPALAAFEQELARRAAAPEAAADKMDAGHLRALLRDHLQAPLLTNADFFSLQVRERIEAERAQAPRPTAGSSWAAWFARLAWPLPRLAALAALGLFVAAALYYGMAPPPAAVPGPALAQAAPPVAAAPAPPGVPTGPRSGDNLLAMNNTPAPDVLPDLAAHIPDPASTRATATPLHYKDSNVNVLWIDGLDYMPTVPDNQPDASPAPSAAAAAPDHG